MLPQVVVVDKLSASNVKTLGDSTFFTLRDVVSIPW